MAIWWEVFGLPPPLTCARYYALGILLTYSVWWLVEEFARGKGQDE